jgi:hypothetical protein
LDSLGEGDFESGAGPIGLSGDIDELDIAAAEW